MPNPANLHDTLAPIRCFMLDMDGTFYLGDQLLEGSLAFLEKLRETGRSALFVTNNSSKSGQVYVEKLRRMGVTEPFLQVLTSGQTAARYCLKHFPGKKAFVLGNDLYKAELAQLGLPMDEEHPDYVLIAYDTTLDYAKMTAVCDFVRAGLPYIATHPDFNCPVDSKTGFEPDIGAVIAFVKASTGREPQVIVGKPNRHIVEAALARTGSDPSRTCMVGDRLYTDIATGLNFGMLSLLVMTGEATYEDLKTTPFKPDIVLPRLCDAIEHLKEV